MPSNVIIYVSTCLEILWLMYVILTLISLLVVLSYSTITNQNCPIGTLLISNPRISNLNYNPNLKYVTLTLILTLSLTLTIDSNGIQHGMCSFLFISICVMVKLVYKYPHMNIYSKINVFPQINVRK
jgi:hypothetical protein